MSTLLIAAIVLLLVYKYYKFAYYKPPNSPPNIPRLPILGSYWILLLRNYNEPYKAIEYYTKQLKSKIIGFYLASFWTVAVNDYDSVKEVLSRDEFDGRFTDITILKKRAYGQKLGLLFTDGPFWHEQRRYFLRNLRDFGFGRRQETFEGEVLNEVSLLIDILKNGPVYNGEKEVMKDNLVLFPDILYPTICNFTWNVLFGRKFDRSEHNIPRRIGRMSMLFQQSSIPLGGSIFFLPFLRYFGNMFGYKNLMKSNYAIADIIQDYLKSQNITLGENVDRGFTDRYLNLLNKNNKLQSFSEKQLIIMLIETIIPTCSALPSTIVCSLKYLIHNPKVLKKTQDEIDRVIGIGRLVTWSDRERLPYMEAVIRETMRLSSSFPVSLFHRAVKDTTLGKYSIPANTIIITNLKAMHCDADLWGDPENFRPERFIDENGELIKDMSFPFSFGHRVCPGETYSRYIIFETLTVLLQNFNFYQVEGEPSSPDDYMPGLLLTPKKCWLRYELR